jgi:L-threonylcarbamoyladenylate synthase
MTASPEDIERAVAVLRAGGLVAFPTETVYGLGADAANPAAVRRVFEVKGRPATHPLIVHLGSAAALDRWAVDVPPAARLLAEACWPGPLTVLLRRSPSVPDVVTGGRDTVGLRVPAHPLALALLERFGGGIAAPSANRFGRVSPTTAADVQADLGSDVDLVLDGGPCQVGVESTIVDLTGGEPEVLRPGGVSFERLEEVLGRPVGLWLGDRDVAAPGTLPAHYAPAARVEVLDEVSAVAERAAQLLAAGRRVAVLAPVALAGLPDGVVELEPAGGPESYARVLYGRLRQADRLGVEVVLAVPPERVGVGVAVRDRLMRAAAAGAAPGHGSST